MSNSDLGARWMRYELMLTLFFLADVTSQDWGAEQFDAELAEAIEDWWDDLGLGPDEIDSRIGGFLFDEEVEPVREVTAALELCDGAMLRASAPARALPEWASVVAAAQAALLVIVRRP